MDLLSSPSFDVKDDSVWLGMGGGGGNTPEACELLLLPEFGSKQPPLSLWIRLGGSGGAIEDTTNLFDDAFEEICTIEFRVIDAEVATLEAVFVVTWVVVTLAAAPLLKVESNATFEARLADCFPAELVDGLFCGDAFVRLVIGNGWY